MGDGDAHRSTDLVQCILHGVQARTFESRGLLEQDGNV